MNQSMRYRVVGISHPLVDIYFNVKEAFLNKCGLTKGRFHHLDFNSFKVIRNLVEKQDHKLKMEPGGSVSNTLWGLNLFGLNVAEFGMIGKDSNGDYLNKKLKENGIGNFLSEHDLPTGTVLCMITPDSERTFAVFRGAAEKFEESYIDTEKIFRSEVLYLTGFELESPGIQETVLNLSKSLKAAGVLIAFDLADSGVLKRNRLLFDEFVRDHVDIVFANEGEALEFTGENAEEAVDRLGGLCSLAVVKTGEKGSFINKDGNIFKIDARKAEPVDTTGAGDMYAAVPETTESSLTPTFSTTSAAFSDAILPVSSMESLLRIP